MGFYKGGNPICKFDLLYQSFIIRRMDIIQKHMAISLLDLL